MTNLELLENYLKLSYVENLKSNIIVDKNLGNYILLRESYFGSTIHYLNNGSSLFIPWKWNNLFSGLYNNSGDQILYKDFSTCDNYFEQFIYLSTKLQLYTLNKYSKIDGPRFLDDLADICTLGTKKFRDYINSKYELDLNPFEYRSIKKSFNI